MSLMPRLNIEHGERNLTLAVLGSLKVPIISAAAERSALRKYDEEMGTNYLAQLRSLIRALNTREATIAPLMQTSAFGMHMASREIAFNHLGESCRIKIVSSEIGLAVSFGENSLPLPNLGKRIVKKYREFLRELKSQEEQKT